MSTSELTAAVRRDLTIAREMERLGLLRAAEDRAGVPGRPDDRERPDQRHVLLRELPTGGYRVQLRFVRHKPG